jgi:hypothetical protein
VNIQQMQVRFDPAADRVLWQVRTSAGELFAVWLTRRMVRLLWPPMHKLVTQAAVAQVAPNSTVLPEAQAMLAQAARERPLPTARFNEPFDTTAVTQPLGPEPLLPEAIDLGPGANARGLQVQVREAGGRRIALSLNDDLATALMRLLEQAITAADWGLAAAPGTPAAPSEPASPIVLN